MGPIKFEEPWLSATYKDTSARNSYISHDAWLEIAKHFEQEANSQIRDQGYDLVAGAAHNREVDLAVNLVATEKDRDGWKLRAERAEHSVSHLEKFKEEVLEALGAANDRVAELENDQHARALRTEGLELDVKRFQTHTAELGRRLDDSEKARDALRGDWAARGRKSRVRRLRCQPFAPRTRR